MVPQGVNRDLCFVRALTIMHSFMSGKQLAYTLKSDLRRRAAGPKPALPPLCFKSSRT